MLPAASSTRRSSLTTTRSRRRLIGDWRGQMLGTTAEPGEVEGLVGVGVAARAPAGSLLGRVRPVIGGEQHQRDLAAGLLLVVGVALVHLHKAREQLAALAGISGPGADGKVLGADLDLGPAGRRQVVVPARMARGAAVGGTQHEAVAVADVGQRSGPLLAGPPPDAREQPNRAAGDEPAADAAVGQAVQRGMEPQDRLGDQLHAVILSCAELVAVSLTADPRQANLVAGGSAGRGRRQG